MYNAPALGYQTLDSKQYVFFQGNLDPILDKKKNKTKN